MNHLDKFLKIALSNTTIWEWPTEWNTEDKHKFIDDAIEYLEKREMYEECKKLYEIKQEIEI